MSLRDDLIRHQILLMRLVKTQAKVTKKFLQNAELIVLKAVENKDYKLLSKNLVENFKLMPTKALGLLTQLAAYEAEFVQKKIKKYKKEVTEVAQEVLVTTLLNSKFKVSLDRKPDTLINHYKTFAATKIQQYKQIVRDSIALDLDEDETEEKVTEKTTGLFSTQNLALAGIAVIGTANLIRAVVARENNYYVRWDAILDERVCGYCEEQDGKVFSSTESLDEIPAHTNCRCMWTLIDESQI